MGKTYKIRLIIRKANSNNYYNDYFGEWRIKTKYGIPGYGLPTTENLSKWRDQFNKSLLPSGANEHLGMKYWLQCNLEVYNQFTHEIVCKYNAPMFEVIN